MAKAPRPGWHTWRTHAFAAAEFTTPALVAALAAQGIDAASAAATHPFLQTLADVFQAGASAEGAVWFRLVGREAADVFETHARASLRAGYREALSVISPPVKPPSKRPTRRRSKP